MDILGIPAIGLGAGGVVAAIALIFTWFTNKDNEEENKAHGEHIGKQKEKQKEIKETSNEQNEIKANIKNTENLSKKKEKEIKDEVKKTSKKVDEIMNKDDQSIANTQDEIDQKWDNL